MRPPGSAVKLRGIENLSGIYLLIRRAKTINALGWLVWRDVTRRYVTD